MNAEKNFPSVKTGRTASNKDPYIPKILRDLTGRGAGGRRVVNPLLP
jgi:hypothetical protein